MRIFAIVAIAALLAGCAAKPLEVGSISRITPENGAQGTDVYAEKRTKGEKVPEFAGDQIVEVRSYEALESGLAGDEFAGAQCNVDARDFSAQVTTPAKVRVPIYRRQSSELSVSCQHPDFKPKSSVVGVYNKTKSDRMAYSGGGGLLGVVAVAVVNEMSDETAHEFQYAPAKLVMEKISGARRQTASAE